MRLTVLPLIFNLAAVWSFNINEGQHLPRGYVVDTIQTVENSWYVSLEVNPFSTVPGFSNILHLTAGDKDNSNYGDRIPGIWLQSDSTKPYICSAVNGNKDYCYKSDDSLPSGQFSKIDIRQVQLATGPYQYRITINGKVVHSIVNSQPRYFTDVKVYAADPWYFPSSVLVRNLVYGNLPHEYKLVKDRLVKEFPIYFNEYDVSFEIQPKGTKSNKFTSILHVTRGKDSKRYGDRIPAVFFRPGTFQLHMCSAVNNNRNYCVDGKSDIPTNRFTKVQITQKWSEATSKYTYKIFIDDKQVHSVVNNNPITLRTIKVYAANPWYDEANAVVKNIEVKTSEGGGFAPQKSWVFSEIPHVGHQWYVAFDIKPVGTTHSVWSNIIHLTLGGNIARYGDRMPGVWFYPGSRKLHICAPINGNRNYCFNTADAIPSGKFTNVRIRQIWDVTASSYEYVISIDGVDKHTIVNAQFQEFDDVTFYASDPWYPAANALIKNVVFKNLPYGFTYGTCSTARTTVENCDDYKGIKSFRTVDGTCNNLNNPTWGASNIPLQRFIAPEYAKDGRLDTPRGFPGTNPILPPPNAVSQELFQVETTNTGSIRRITAIFMTFGQFLDHDITETPLTACPQTTCGTSNAWQFPCFPLLFNESTTCSINGRSNAVCSNRAYLEPRQQLNHLSAYVDGSQIYSNEEELFEKLRSHKDGLMKLTKQGLLPKENEEGKNGCTTIGGCSLVGDIRGDENIALHSMHTLWVREHNRIAKELKTLNPSWDDEELFQTSRKINVALWQHLTYKEYLPLLASLTPYSGYKPNVDASLTNVFSTAAFRYGHSLIPNEFAQLDNNFDKKYEPVVLQEAFFNRKFINDRKIGPTMRGLVGNMSNNVDDSFAISVARKLFVGVGSTGYLDLTALNIQRGRDHGLPAYSKYREACGLSVPKTWDDVIAIMLDGAGERFRNIYRSPDDIDIFAGGISEKHTGNLQIGPTFNCILSKQFAAVRDGDRFYYENKDVFTTAQLNAIKKVTLATILCNNIKGLVSVQPNAFRTPDSNQNIRKTCQSLPKLDLDPWKESNSVRDVKKTETEQLENLFDQNLGDLPSRKTTHRNSKKELEKRLERIVFNKVKRKLEEDFFHDNKASYNNPRNNYDSFDDDNNDDDDDNVDDDYEVAYDDDFKK